MSGLEWHGCIGRARLGTNRYARNGVAMLKLGGPDSKVVDARAAHKIQQLLFSSRGHSLITGAAENVGREGVI